MAKHRITGEGMFERMPNQRDLPVIEITSSTQIPPQQLGRLVLGAQ